MMFCSENFRICITIGHLQLTLFFKRLCIAWPLEAQQSKDKLADTKLGLCVSFLFNVSFPAVRTYSTRRTHFTQHTLASNYLLHLPLSRGTGEQEIDRGLKENSQAIFGHSLTKTLVSCFKCLNTRSVIPENMEKVRDFEFNLDTN